MCVLAETTEGTDSKTAKSGVRERKGERKEGQGGKKRKEKERGRERERRESAEINLRSLFKGEHSTCDPRARRFAAPQKFVFAFTASV